MSEQAFCEHCSVHSYRKLFADFFCEVLIVCNLYYFVHSVINDDNKFTSLHTACCVELYSAYCSSHIVVLWKCIARNRRKTRQWQK